MQFGKEVGRSRAAPYSAQLRRSCLPCPLQHLLVGQKGGGWSLDSRWHLPSATLMAAPSAAPSAPSSDSKNLLRKPSSTRVQMSPWASKGGGGDLVLRCLKGQALPAVAKGRAGPALLPTPARS